MRSNLLFPLKLLITGGLVLGSLPAGAEKPIFGQISLTPGFKAPTGISAGYTSGSTSLPAIVANSDYTGNKCLGFADKVPDYVMVLEEDFPTLQIKVDSNGRDTTLAIKGPGGKIRCGDDTGNSKDASVIDKNWNRGEYQIWVGSIEAGQRWNYKLTINQ